MKIQKGHYVPKELIASEAVHEAVVKCFVAAGFHRNSDYVNYRAKEHWDCIAISGSGFICWSGKQEKPLTLQQLFAAENALQWPDWAVSIKSYGPNCVAFYGECGLVLIAGNLMEFERNDAAILATRQPNGEVSEISESKPGAESQKEFGKKDFSQDLSFIANPAIVSENPESNWHERGELPPVGEHCEYKIGLSGDYSKCTFVGINSNKNFVIEVYGKYSSYHESQIVFRPIRTEREKVIEAAVTICAAMKPNTVERMEALYNAGMLVLPQDSGDTED